MASRRDLYLRFDLSRQPKGLLSKAGLALKLAGKLEAPFRARVYALSDRFVPAAGEMGDDWTENLLVAANAPGRGLVADDYRVGDAALVYLGDWETSVVADGTVRWESAALAEAVSRVMGKTVSLLIVPEEGVNVRFHSKEYGASDAPRLTIQY